LNSRINNVRPNRIYPAHTITYSSIITILLAICVLLVPIAKTPNSQKLNTDKQAFAGSTRYMGLGTVFAKNITNLSANTADKYAVIDLNNAIRLNAINVRERELGKMFDRVARQMKAMNSPLKTQRINFSAMDIEFAAGESVLDSTAQNYLKKYAENLQQARPAGHIKLYIAATAGEVNDIKQQYLLSSQRAYQVEAFLKSSLPAGFNCPIYSVGTAADRDSATASQVMVAVLQNEKD
jgi:outer membrane protein OmpA-like peptidoglycan-associated protein